ncbi:MAG: signal peptide peptidase SppA [Desulfovibrionaceae bacterium]
MMLRRTVFLFSIVLLTACGKMNLFSGPEPFTEVTLSGNSSDKIAVIHISGLISNTSEKGLLLSKPSIVQEVVAQLRLAGKDSSVKAILLLINSPGGSVTASDILYHEISTIKKEFVKPVYSLMMDVAASGGYYIALASDKIIAHPTTVTGSIGVISVRMNAEELLGKIGVNISANKSGAMKDMGAPYKAATEEEKRVFQNIVDTFNTIFQNLVAERRPQSVTYKAFFNDGRIITAQQAKEYALIDSIGYFSDTVTMMESVLNIENAKIITYKREELPHGTEYNTTVSLPKIGESALLPASMWLHTGMYYLWFPEMF